MRSSSRRLVWPREPRQPALIEPYVRFFPNTAFRRCSCGRCRLAGVADRPGEDEDAEPVDTRQCAPGPCAVTRAQSEVGSLPSTSAPAGATAPERTPRADPSPAQGDPALGLSPHPG